VAELGGARDAVPDDSPRLLEHAATFRAASIHSVPAKQSHSPRFQFAPPRSLSLLFTGVVVAAGRAGETVAFREPPQSRVAQIQQILDDVPSAPPELGADILLKLVERGEITDAKLKRQILDDAW